MLRGGTVVQTVEARIVWIEVLVGLHAICHHAITHGARTTTTLDAFQVKKDWSSMVRSWPWYGLV